MVDFFNDFDKVNEKENPKPGTVEKTETTGEKVEEKEESADFSKTLESLRNEISALKELLKNSSNNNSAEEAKNKTESEEKEA